MATLYFPLKTPPSGTPKTTPIENTLYSPTENGYMITRRKFTKSRRIIEASWDCSETEYLLIEEFFFGATQEGASPFLLDFSLGNIKFNRPVIFINPPVFNYKGIGTWEASCKFQEV